MTYNFIDYSDIQQLYRIGRHLNPDQAKRYVIDELRKYTHSRRKHKPQFNNYDDLDFIEDKTNDNNGHSSLINSDIQDQIRSLIEDLPEQQRICIALYFYEELTMKEIAYILKLSEARISQIINEALENIRKENQDDQPNQI